MKRLMRVLRHWRKLVLGVLMAGVTGMVYTPVAKATDAADYMVIDLSAGPSATNYPVSYLDVEPDGGWTDEHKTTKLVMRRIPAGTFTMGSPTNELGRNSDETQREVTLTQDYYMGVFQVTQRQWERVMGAWPSYFNNEDYRDARPVDQVSYYDVRENPANSAISPNWPESSEVHVDSFMGKLRAKTGLETLDLPTEAQWERAARAGTTSALNTGENLTSGDACPNMSEVGRYWFNGGSGFSQAGDTSVGTATVGSYLPNAWGLYDMHGNVWEWCLDWYEAYHAPAVDPVGAALGSHRTRRGGSWDYGARDCRSANRGYYYLPDTRYYNIGFRLSRTLPAEQHTLTVSSGTGGGAYTAGTPVDVVADAAPVGHIFDGWLVDPSNADLGEGFNPAAASTTVTMQAHDVTLTAQWRRVAVAAVSPVYRFWSDRCRSHFLTASEAEKEHVMDTWSDVWTYEGIAFYAHLQAVDGSSPVHRFWSARVQCHLYSISDEEKAQLESRFPSAFQYEGHAWHAFDYQAPGTLPVYRFWAPRSKRAFFTISETEKAGMLADTSGTWRYEGIAWYAYPSAELPSDNGVPQSNAYAQIDPTVVPGIPAGMVLVPGGTNSGVDPDFGAYSLTVESFFMDRYEVTKGLWDVVRDWGWEHGYPDLPVGGGKAFENAPAAMAASSVVTPLDVAVENYPVHTVSWFDAVKWCNARSEMEGKEPVYYEDDDRIVVYRSGDVLAPYADASATGYRLPLSRQWEYAARGGLVGLRFPWGDTITHANANYASAFSSKEAYDLETEYGLHPDYEVGLEPYTSPVGSFEQNGYGLFDLVGNVAEWCEDWLPGYEGQSRIVRGGFWNHRASYGRVGDVYWDRPVYADDDFGFRTVMAAPPEDTPTASPVHRFWSDSLASHFFTASETEKHNVIANGSDVWTYEGIAFYAHVQAVDGSSPVHRFWSDRIRCHLFTISDDEKAQLESRFPKAFQYEGHAWHAFAYQAPGTLPVYRFWAPRSKRAFFTISETEKANVIATMSGTWRYEGIAWYAYPAAPALVPVPVSMVDHDADDSRVAAKTDTVEPAELHDARQAEAVEKPSGSISQAHVVASAAHVRVAEETDGMYVPLQYTDTVVTASVYDPDLDAWEQVLPATWEPAGVSIAGGVTNRQWLLVLTYDAATEGWEVAHGSWFGRMQQPAPDDPDVALTAELPVEIGLPVEVISLPADSGALRLQVYDLDADAYIQTVQGLRGGARYEWTVPQWNRWYRVDVVREQDGTVLQSQWIGHRVTHTSDAG